MSACVLAWGWSILPIWISYSRLTAVMFQCSGTSPSHSTPEGLSRALGSRPRVTAWWTSARRSSLQQGDEPLLAGDVALDLLVGVVEEPDNGGLFLGRWDRYHLGTEFGEPEV